MAALRFLAAFHITFRVAEPAAWARHLRLCSSANAVTRQGLGEVTNEVRNGAGNPVLGDVGFCLYVRRDVSLSFHTNAAHHRQQKTERRDLSTIPKLSTSYVIAQVA